MYQRKKMKEYILNRKKDKLM